KYYDLFTSKTNTATGVDELAILQASVNVGESKTSGVDWHINHFTDLSFGSFYIDWTGTYMIESTYTRPGTTDDWITSMGRFGDNNAVTFRLISQVSFGLEQDNFYHNLTLNYKSGYLDQLQSANNCSVTEVDAFGDCVDVQLNISSYSKVDYQSKYNITDNASLTFGINNLFDTQPDLSLRSGGAGHQVGYDPRYVDSYGRTFYLAGEYTF
ncbi:MAG: TonB-dependent receptor, partial [Colwellia sp.]|nr:TonB-dependent receptor [Colwellia sp.]